MPGQTQPKRLHPRTIATQVKVNEKCLGCDNLATTVSISCNPINVTEPLKFEYSWVARTADPEAAETDGSVDRWTGTTVDRLQQINIEIVSKQTEILKELKKEIDIVNVIVIEQPQDGTTKNNPSRPQHRPRELQHRGLG